MAISITATKPKLTFIKTTNQFVVSNLSFLFCLHGSVTITSSSDSNLNRKTFTAGQLIALNGVYTVHPAETSLSCVLSFSNQYCQESIPNFENLKFTLSPKEYAGQFKKYYSLVRQTFADLILLWTSQETDSLEYNRKILDFLIVNVKYFSQQFITHASDNSINAIVNYLNSNYQDDLSLKSIAEHFFLSTSYLSRQFTTEIGVGFHEYLSSIRVKYASDELLTSKRSIDEIAFNSGFSSSRTFSRAFKKFTHLTPHQYRQQYLASNTTEQDQAPKPTANSNVLELLQPYLDETNAQDFPVNFYTEKTSTYVIDCAPAKQVKTRRPFQLPRIMITVDSFQNVLRTDIRKQLQLIQNEVGHLSVQIKLDPTTFLLQNNESFFPMSSPFEIWDQVINYLFEHQMRIMFQIDEEQFKQMPQSFASFCEHYSHTSYGHHDYVDHWAFVLKQHTEFTENIAATFITFAKLFTLYFNQPQSIGLSLLQINNAAYTTNILQRIMENEGTIGFIDYSMNQNDYITDDLDYSIDSIQDEDLKILISIQKKLGLKCQLYLSNWNTITGQSHFSNGYFFRGALIAQAILEHVNRVAAIGFWINTELFEQNAAEKQTAAGISLIHYHNGRRPAFYSLSLLSRLHGDLIFLNEHVIITKQQDNYGILLLNPNLFNPQLSTNKILLKQQELLVNLTLKNILPGRYKIKKHTFDMNHGALYFLTQRLMTPSGIDDETMDYITDHAVPDLLVYEATVQDSLNISNYILYNGLTLYEIRLISK